ncbi:MAG: M3 family metallopeptidase [Micavibrio sp.]|nr:M3 family metallopeptidase [Micavibrio sp.]
MRKSFTASSRKTGHKNDRPVHNLRRSFSSAVDGGGANDNLPRWNLGLLYPGLDSAELQADKQAADARADSFAETYEKTIAYLSGPELGDAIAEYEAIENIRGKISSYVGLLEVDNLGNFTKTDGLKKWQSEIGGKIGFFEAEIAEMKERDLMTKLGAAPALAAYAPWIAGLRAGRSYMVDGDVDSLSAEYYNSNREAWRRLYHENYNEMRVDVDGKKLSIDAVSEMIGDAKTDVALRASLRQKIADTLKENAPRTALIYNTLIKDKLIDMDVRQFSRPDAEENAGNGITDDVVDTMHKTVKASYARLSHRLNSWKAKQHGVEVMERAQLGISLPDTPEKGGKGFGFDDARKTILRAFRKFSPKFARIAQKFFDDGRIDAQPRADKETGAFAMPTGPGSLPYVFMSYTNDIGSLVTLGHELGHGVHQVLAEKARGLFLSEMSTTVSETASIFAEMLVFEEMLKSQKDPATRKDLLMDKVEGMIQNGLQQLSYYDFEKQVHEARKKGELSAEDISDIWVATQKEYYGPAVELDDYERHYWMVVPHFYDTPFYVYSYAFAQIQVAGLYQEYKAAAAEGGGAREAFVANYIDLLETGITRNLYESLRPFDLDPETPEFWEKGLSLMESYLDELEKLDVPAAKPAVKAAATKGKAGKKPKL